MAWSFGHSLIVVLAVLLGLAAGWLLRGRRGVQGSSIVDGDPVAGLAVISTPTPAATTDEAKPVAAVDPAPTAVADEPVPVDTVSEPAAVTAPDGPTPVPVPADAPSTVDPADMALTEDPPPVPDAEPSDTGELRQEPALEPATVDQQPAPAAVVAPRQPADDIAPADTAPLDTTPAATTPIDDAPVDTTAVDATPVDATPDDNTPVDTTSGVATSVDDAPVAATPADSTPAEASPAGDAPASGDAESTATTVDPAATPETAEPAQAESAVDATEAEQVAAVATPPVRPVDTATSPVRSNADTTISDADADADPTGPADDFRRIQGVGPKMAAALQDAGVRTYRQLGELDEQALRDLIRAAGLRAAPGLASWPQQARVLAGAGDEMAAVLPTGNPA